MNEAFSVSGAPFCGFGLADPAPKGYGVDPCLLRLLEGQNVPCDFGGQNVL